MLFFIALQAATAVPLAPTRPWNLELKPDRCILSRTFGTVDPVTIALIPLAGGDHVELQIGLGGKDAQPRSGNVKLVLLPAGNSFESDHVQYRGPAPNSAINRAYFSADVLSAMSIAQEMRIQWRSKTVSLAIRQPAKPLATLKNCQIDLLKSWGVEPTSLGGNSSVKATEIERLFGDPSNYPEEALDARMQGLVVSVLNISRGGVVDDCRVVVSAGEPLDKQTCRLFRRVKFTPATDKDENPVASTIIVRFRWALPVR